MVKYLHSALFILLAPLAIGQTNSNSSTNMNNEALKNSSSNPQPENYNSVSSPSQDVRSVNYFKTEADNFEEKTRSAPQSAQAWLNYYKSTLFSYFNGSSKQLTEAQKEELDDILDEMRNKIPESFEYNIAAYINGRHNTALLPKLARAEELNGNNLDVIEQFAAYYAITGNVSKCVSYSQKYKKQSKYESFFDDYAYNLLKSVEANSVLFTHGALDTYPVFLAQSNDKSKAGVTIINIDYLNSKEYREKLNTKLGITVGFNGNIYSCAFDIAEKLNGKKEVYFSNSFSKNDLKKHVDNLQINGLCFRYGASGANTAQLEKWWKKEAKLSSLENGSYKDDYAKKMANNYQPALVALYNYYKNSGEKAEADKIKSLAQKIATKSGNASQIAALMN